ncbi:MAG: MarR family winged helix-turn-helix transcriptional regulator [Trebonia sp.]
MSQPAGDPDELGLLVADVFEVAGVLRHYGERIAATAGQTQARWQLLSVVSDGDWTVPAAADRLGTSRQAVQRIANELVHDGLATFDDNPRHRRSPFLRLSADGRRALTAISAKARLENHAIVSGLDGLDLLRICADLRQLTSAVRVRLEDAGPWQSWPE